MAKKAPFLLLILALSVAHFISSAIAVSETPFIVAHKKVALTKLKPGSERVSVSIDIYNRGLAPVYDVSLTDNSWSPNVFAAVNGSSSQSWERLDAGSILSHSFELECRVKIVYHGEPALITFRIPTKPRLQEAYSTPIWPLEILADRATKRNFELAKELLAKYGAHISVVLIIAGFAHIILSPPKSSAANGNKKRH